MPTWSSKADMPVASNSRRLIGPAVPDLLPTVSHFEVRLMFLCYSEIAMMFIGANQVVIVMSSAIK